MAEVEDLGVGYIHLQVAAIPKVLTKLGYGKLVRRDARPFAWVSTRHDLVCKAKSNVRFERRKRVHEALCGQTRLSTGSTKC